MGSFAGELPVLGGVERAVCQQSYEGSLLYVTGRFRRLLSCCHSCVWFMLRYHYYLYRPFTSLEMQAIGLTLHTYLPNFGSTGFV